MPIGTPIADILMLTYRYMPGNLIRIIIHETFERIKVQTSSGYHSTILHSREGGQVWGYFNTFMTNNVKIHDNNFMNRRARKI